jgi:hypothetical protein
VPYLWSLLRHQLVAAACGLAQHTCTAVTNPVPHLRPLLWWQRVVEVLQQLVVGVVALAVVRLVKHQQAHVTHLHQQRHTQVRFTTCHLGSGWSTLHRK